MSPPWFTLEAGLCLEFPSALFPAAGWLGFSFSGQLKTAFFLRRRQLGLMVCPFCWATPRCSPAHDERTFFCHTMAHYVSHLSDNEVMDVSRLLDLTPFICLFQPFNMFIKSLIDALMQCNQSFSHRSHSFQSVRHAFLQDFLLGP